MDLITEWFGADAPDKLPKGPREAAMVPTLVLAYLGDTLYDLYIRTRLALESDAPAGQLHRQAIPLVCAHGQALALQQVLPTLSAEELDVVRRGRNAKAASSPRHASLEDYHQATALETLLGYLYLCGHSDRARDIMRLAFTQNEEEKVHG